MGSKATCLLMFDTVDWHALFAIEMPLLEIFLRGTVIYLAVFLLLRVAMKRQTGGMGINDLLVVVMIVGASKNALTGDSHSLMDSILLVATVLGWAHAINWLSYHFPKLGDLLSNDAVPLVRQGRVNHRNLRRELITMEEFQSQLRVLGVEDVAQVKNAFMEPDGKISVVTFDEGRTRSTKRRQQDAGGE